MYKLSRELVIDSVAAYHEVGDVMRPIERGLLKEADIFHIAELVVGRRTIDVSRTTAYKSVGMALYDVYVADAFYQAAEQRNIGRELDL